MSFPHLNATTAIVDGQGKPSSYFMGWINALIDMVTVAAAQASSAAISARNVVATGGLQGGGSLADEVGISLYRSVCVVSALPTAGNKEGDWSYALDGRKPGEASGAGTGIPVFRSNGAWFAVTGAAVTT